MTMLNQAAVEALCSATYLENYLDTMENLPDDLQRCVSSLRELDLHCREIMRDLDHHHETYKNESEGSVQRKKASIAIQRLLIQCQEIGDEKLTILALITEHIENRSRQLEQDRENLDPGSTKDPEREELLIPVTPVIKQTKQPQQQHQQPQQQQEAEKTEKTGSKRQRRQKSNNDYGTNHDDKKEEKEKVPKKKKKRKIKKEKEDSPLDFPIDPDEPTYCLCEQVSYGEMIGCDNDACVIEWFHFNCVGLTNKPKGKWFCPKCRGENSKVMRKM